MKLSETIGVILNAWTGSVAAAVVAGFDRVVSPRVIRLIEDETGEFAVETAGNPGNPDKLPVRISFVGGTLSAPNLSSMFRGSRVEIVLKPARFLFRPLELPARGGRFP